VPTHIAPFEGIEQADELIAFFGRRFAAKGGIRWGLTLKGDDTIIGTAGFPGIDDETYRARLTDSGRADRSTLTHAAGR
jgi:ribosomal-protein-alanine N-acetyltransferase